MSDRDDLDQNHRESAAGLPKTVNYRYADDTGGELFVAGQVPRDSAGRLVGEGDAARQATQCLDNLATLMALHDYSPAELRHLTIYVVGDHDALAAGWGAVEEWFDQDVPPATLLGVALLGHRGQLVEVDARITRER